MTPSVEMEATLREIQGDLREIKNALFGSEYSEGRLPILENAVKDHGKRIGTLERFYWKLTGAIVLAVGLFETLIHWTAKH